MGYFLLEHQIDLLRTLYDNGLSDSAIHRKSGISEVAIARWRKLRGLDSNYVKKVGMPPPYTRHNFENCFNYREHIERWYAEVGAVTRDEKRLALKFAAKEMIRLREGRLA
jgi:hypothetical protein